ncbi:MAG TPA: YciI family protein [Streptosporangiaceae bacterium]|nr:YciI family protein [Streptosporangiaceae bacterium]
MMQYLLTVYQPDGDPPPPEVLDPIMAGVQAWRSDLKAAGSWVFSAGLHPASTATVVRVSGGETLTTDGPFTEGKEHVGGFTILRLPDLDAALESARKLADVTHLPIEVRPLQGEVQD